MTQSTMHNHQRRNAIKFGLTHAAIFALGATHLPLKANQSNGTQSDINMGVNELTKALRAMENDVCNTAATNLENSHRTGASLYLHLRNAGLNISNALAIAEALRKHSNTTNFPLLSFSVSYNRELGDTGVEALAKSLPRTLQEIGFVDCNIEDKGGEAILQWANQAPNLKMICIERNNLTKETLSLFNIFKQTNPEVTLFL